MNEMNSADTPPSTVLRDEHVVIKRVMAVLQKLVERSEQGVTFESESLGQCVEFFRLFADACHHAKEEDLLFPVLEQRGVPRDGGPIGVMLYEHTVARKLTKQMGEALEASSSGDAEAEPRFRVVARQYVELLTNHIQKEGDILFTMGDNVMTADDQAALCAKFCEVGCRTFGGKKREELAGIADALETQWSAL